MARAQIPPIGQIWLEDEVCRANTCGQNTTPSLLQNNMAHSKCQN
jgi:hypothetical protein